MKNEFDAFDPAASVAVQENPFDHFDAAGANDFDQFDATPSRLTMEQAVNVGGDVVAEAAGATAGQMLGTLGGPFAPVTVPVGGAIGGAVGNSVAQLRRMARDEQAGFHVGEMLAAAGISAIPGGQFAKGATVAGRVARSAAVMGGAGAAGSVVRQAVDEPGHGIDLGQVAHDAALGAAGGAAVQGGIEGVSALAAKVLKRGVAVPIERAPVADEPSPEVLASIAELAGGSAPEPRAPLPLLSTVEDSAPAAGGVRDPVASPTAEAIAPMSSAERTRLAAQFDAARAEEALQQVKAEQLAGPETVQLGDDPLKNQITAIETRPGASAAQRARVEAKIAETVPQVDDGTLPAGVTLSRQAQRMSDEHGRIDPAVLLPVARSAVGGALGYATGDTPEERTRNALIGMGFGAAASPALVRRLTNQVLSAPVTEAAAQSARAAAQRLRQLVAPQSFLPREIRDAVRFGEQASNAVTRAGLSLTGDLEHAIKGVGDLAARGAAADATHDFLTGAGPLSAVPAPARIAAQKVRFFVDSLSDRAVAEGVVTGPSAQTFLDNRGSYLRRSYDIFLDPNFKPEPAKVQAAISAVSTANGMPRAEAEGIVAGILDKNQRAALGDYLVGRGKIAGKDVSSLVKRNDLLPEVRAMLGEVTDPILAANQTIPRLARLIENDAAQKQMRDIGSRLGIFSDVQSLTHPSPLVAEGSATHDVLSGLYAAPEIAGALQRIGSTGKLSGVPEVLWRTLTTGTGLAKMAKTVANPEGYAPNAIGGVIQMLANGNFRLDALGRGVALGGEELGALRAFSPSAPVRDTLRAELFNLRKLGLLSESAAGEDLLRTIERSYWGVLGNKAKSVLTLPARVYGGIDDVTRYAAYRSELQLSTLA
jgi:hypothetical protein